MIASVGADLSSKLKLFFITFWIPRFFNIKIRIKKFGKTVTIVLRSWSDLAVFEAIFVNEEYHIDLKEEPGIIFDLGSNVGFAAIYFKLKYPNAKIFCFEPDPRTFQHLSENISQFTNVFLFNIAVGSENGEDNFWILPDGLGSSLVKRDQATAVLKRECKTIDKVMEILSVDQIDLLKFDIEGAEFNVFKHFKNIFKVDNFIGEVHLDLINENKETFLNLFKDFSLQLVGISPKRFLLRAQKE